MLILAVLAVLWPSVAAAQGTLIPFVPQTFYDANGDPCSGCKLYTYAAGTTTPQATYTTVTLDPGTPNANPVVMNAAGRPTTGYIFLSATSYKFLLASAADVTIWTVDNATAVPTTAGNVDITGIAGEALSAGDLAYLSDGSGALTAGRWYKADADNTYSSTTPQLAFVPTAIASAATGTLRIAGRMTGLSGLTAGTIYYVSATAGGLTATAPSNSRIVGQADTTTSLILGSAPATTAQPLNTAEGRCTLTTATPVTTGDVTAATTVYYTPYAGNRIALYDGTATWNIRTFTELSIAVPATTSTMYDLWVYDNAGTAALEALAWTNDTTRATALTTQNGVLVKTGVTTRRYVCSFRTTGVSGQTEDSFAKRYLSNYYNRVPRVMRVLEATNSWTVAGSSFGQANASAANQLDFVVGVAEVALSAQVIGVCSADTAADNMAVGIGLDSTSAAATGAVFIESDEFVADYHVGLTASLDTYPAVGRHIATWLERGDATTTCYGDNGPQSGITGQIGG